MAFADQLAAIETHAQAAGAAMTPPMTDIVIGLPWPRGRCARVFWDGETEPARIDRRAIGEEHVSQRISVTAWWPVSDAGEAASEQLMSEMREFAHQMRTRVLGDSQLGGMSTDLEMEYASPDFVPWGGQLYASVGMTFVTDFDVYPIAP